MMNEAPQRPTAGPLRRAAIASLALAAVLTVWTAYIVASGPGDKSFVGMLVVLIPPVAAAYFAVSLLSCWLVLRLAAQLTGSRRRRAMLKLGMAGAAALGVLGAILIFMVCEPRYLTPPYRLFKNIVHAGGSDFTAPWGARMIALEIPAEPRVNRQPHTLWVAETELTRGEYEGLSGAKIGGDPALPMTSLSRAQVEALLIGVNRMAKPARAGTYRLPRLEEMRLYSGDWWINTYPKTLYRCGSQLGAAATQPANGLGLRATVDNASELVVVDNAAYRGLCSTEGSMASHCGKPYLGKYAGISACEDRDSDKVWSHPSVGMRIVFSAAQD